MSEYHYKKNFHRQMRKAHKATRNMYVLLLLVLVFISGFGVYIWQQISVDNTIQQVSPVRLGIYNGTPRKEYVNEVFSFTSTTDWQFVREASTPPTKYIYSSNINGLVQHELTIYINSIPSLPVSYITPVNVVNGKIMPGATSPKCTDKQANPKNILNFAFKDVKYICDFVNSNEKIAAGVVGGSYAIPLYNPAGKLANVGVYFTDHSPGYRPEIFNDILMSFKLR